jgi:transcriptional regulator with XRE-family HTH domain
MALARTAHFDAPGFYAALDAERESREMSWRDVAEEVGVSPSTFSRMARGRRPDLDSAAQIARWSGLSLDSYVLGRKRGVWPDPLTLMTELLLRDHRLSEEGRAAMVELVRVTYRRLRKDSGKGARKARAGR